MTGPPVLCGWPSPQSSGQTSLHTASRYGALLAVRVLVRRGVGVNTRDVCMTHQLTGVFRVRFRDSVINALVFTTIYLRMKVQARWTLQGVSATSRWSPS
jgi:hypothetical protein